MAKKKTTTKRAPAKKAPTKKAPNKKRAPAKKKAPNKKRAPAKKKAPMVIEDPDKMPSPVLKSKFKPEHREKVLGAMATSVRDSINKISERSKTRPVHLYTPAMLRKLLIPYDEIAMQHAIASIGFRVRTAIELIAPDHVGKTTFIFDFIGRMLDLGCYSVYVECEDKHMETSHIKRVLDRDKKVATLKLNSIEFASARSLVECDEVMYKSVVDLRARCDENPETKGNPIFVFVDPWSGLMSASEAQGNSDWGLSAQAAAKAKKKDSLTGSNMGHARHAQVLKRKLPKFMEENNAVVVFVNHQNERVDMSGFKSFITPSETKNDTRIGGRAFRQLCSYRFTLLNVGDLRDKSGDKTLYGHKVRLTMIKNSYGPRGRQCDFSILFDNYDDTPDRYAPVLSFAEGTANWMVQRGLLGTTLSDKLYTCDALGCVGVNADTLYAALKSNPEKLEFIGSALRIEGYASEVQHKDPEPDPECLPPVVPAGDAPPTVPEDPTPAATGKPPVVPGIAIPPVVPGGETV